MRQLVVTVFLVGGIIAGRAAAQTVSATMGAIDGRVTDNTNAVLPGVTVTISGAALMGARVVTTSEQGAYRIVAVPPGDYTIVFELSGFAPLKRTEIRVDLGFTVTLNVQMALSGVSENVTVTGASPVVDTTSTKITTTFDAPMLASLPSGSRDYWSLLSETPALKLTRIDVGGSSAGSQSNYYAYGTTGQNRPMIEGINSTQGTERFGNYVDMGSFDEIAVNAAAHTAEMAVPGIQMVFISKSGGNAYHGSLVGHYENERWQSFNIDDRQIALGASGGGGLAPRDVNRLHKFRDLGADVGGYIIKDRFWWYAAVRDLEIRRNQLLGSISYFRHGWLGDHNFKFGWEIFRDTTTQGDPAGSYGDVVHILRQGAPLEVYLLGNPTQSVNGLWTYGTYATDTWRATKRLSVNIGLRFDRYRNFLPEQFHQAGRFNPATTTYPAVDALNIWNTLAPRIGATVDLSGDGKTMIKGNYGRYWWNPGAELSATANPNPPVWQRRLVWNDTNGDRLWQPGEEGRLIAALGGGATSTIAPGLEDARTEEVAAWLEREWAANRGVRGGFVWRTERQLSQLLNANQPFSGFSVPVKIPDPGADGTVGTNDDGAAIRAWNLAAQYVGLPVLNVLTNVPNARTNYYTWEIAATKRMSRGWSVIASLAHTTSYAQANTFFDTSFRQNPLPVTPNDLINTEPNGQEKSADFTGKLTASWQGPWGLKVSPMYRYQGGQNFGRTIVVSLNYG